MVIAEKQVEYVDLRIRPELLEGVFECRSTTSPTNAPSPAVPTMERPGIDPANLFDSQ